jgi:alpha-mannosidase
MRITGVESTDLFTGRVGRPLQVVRVSVAATDAAEAGAAVGVRVVGGGVETTRPFGITLGEPGESRSGEVSVAVTGSPGVSLPVTVICETDGARVTSDASITVAEPGWTMWMVSHFHYDPVWWNTQGQFTEARLVLPDEDGKRISSSSSAGCRRAALGRVPRRRPQRAVSSHRKPARCHRRAPRARIGSTRR